MARARNIKPGFFKNEVLGAMEPGVRLLFVGLWTVADREGRLEYRPKRIWMEVCPYDPSFDVEESIAKLIDGGFLIPYEANGLQLLQIVNWLKHQMPHHKETASVFPPPPGHSNGVCDDYIPLSNTIRNRIYLRDGRKCKQCGAVSGLSIDHIIPVSRGGNSVDSNLQVLCMGCNFQKGNRIPSNSQSQAVHESCTVHAQVEQSAPCPTDSLIPSSLIPSSLIPGEALSGKPDPDPQKVNKKINGHKQEALEVLQFLNEKTGRAYRPLPANLEMITARLKEGASVMDCRKVIAKKCREWATDEKMNPYLRPATLFNRKNFAQYSGELVVTEEMQHG